MNELYITINFTKQKFLISGVDLISGDYNSTKIKFNFEDNKEGTKILEIRPLNSETNNPTFMSEIINNEVILASRDEEEHYISPFTEGGTYLMEVSVYGENSKLSTITKHFNVLENQISLEDEIVSPYLPIFDELMQEIITATNEASNLNITAQKIGAITKVTITNKEGVSKTVEIHDGIPGRGIVSIIKTKTTENIDTYTITYTDGTTSTFNVTNGELTREQMLNDLNFLFNILPKVNDYGNDLYLTGTGHSNLIRFDMEGKSVQKETPSVSTPIPIESIGYTNLLTEEFEQGNSSSSSTTRIRSKNLIPITKGKSYILTWYGENASNYDYVIITSNKSTYPFSNYQYCGNPSTWTHKSPIIFTATNDGYLGVSIRYPDNSTISPSDFYGVNLMVTSDSRVHPYIVKDDKYYVDIHTTRKNLLNVQNVNEYDTHNLTISVSNNTINIDGTCNLTTSYYITSIIPFNLYNNQTYTLSGVQTGTISRTFTINLLNYTSQERILVSTNNGNLPYTINNVSGIVNYIKLYIHSGTAFTNYQIKLQLEKGNQATSYEIPINNYNIYCINDSLKSVGSIKDIMSIDNAELTIKRNIGEISSYTSEAITTDYISSTGSLSEGANVIYVLENPIIETIGGVEQPLTYDNITNIYYCNSLNTTLSGTALKNITNL